MKACSLEMLLFYFQCFFVGRVVWHIEDIRLNRLKSQRVLEEYTISQPSNQPTVKHGHGMDNVCKVSRLVG